MHFNLINLPHVELEQRVDGEKAGVWLRKNLIVCITSGVLPGRGAGGNV